MLRLPIRSFSFQYDSDNDSYYAIPTSRDSTAPFVNVIIFFVNLVLVSKKLQPIIARTMDDSLEQPNAMADPFTERHDEDQENSSGDEDGGLDWTKIP